MDSQVNVYFWYGIAKPSPEGKVQRDAKAFFWSEFEYWQCMQVWVFTNDGQCVQKPANVAL